MRRIHFTAPAWLSMELSAFARERSYDKRAAPMKLRAMIDKAFESWLTETFQGRFAQRFDEWIGQGLLIDESADETGAPVHSDPETSGEIDLGVSDLTDVGF